MLDLRRLFIENWAIKIISLLLSVTLWFYVTSKGKTEVSLTVPLELRNIPAGMAVVGDVPGTLEVRVQGQERLLRDMSISRKIVAVADLSPAHEGANILRISPDDVRRPSGISITHLAPYDIRVSLERLVRKTIRLKPVISGASPGRVASVAVSPQKITVEGPSSAMNNLASLATMPIDVSGIKGRITVEPRIDYQGRPVKILDQGITVTIIMRKEHS